MLQGGGDTPALGRYFTSLPRSAHLLSSLTRTTFSRTCCISSSKVLGLDTQKDDPGPLGCRSMHFDRRELLQK